MKQPESKTLLTSERFYCLTEYLVRMEFAEKAQLIRLLISSEEGFTQSKANRCVNLFIKKMGSALFSFGQDNNPFYTMNELLYKMDDKHIRKDIAAWYMLYQRVSLAGVKHGGFPWSYITSDGQRIGVLTDTDSIETYKKVTKAKTPCVLIATSDETEEQAKILAKKLNGTAVRFTRDGFDTKPHIRFI